MRSDIRGVGRSWIVLRFCNLLLLALVITNLMEGCQDEVAILLLFVDDLVLICQTRKQANDRLGLSRKTFESHGLKISSIDIEYMECQFSGNGQN